MINKKYKDADDLRSMGKQQVAIASTMVSSILPQSLLFSVLYDINFDPFFVSLLSVLCQLYVP